MESNSSSPNHCSGNHNPTAEQLDRAAVSCTYQPISKPPEPSELSVPQCSKPSEPSELSVPQCLLSGPFSDALGMSTESAKFSSDTELDSEAISNSEESGQELTVSQPVKISPHTTAAQQNKVGGFMFPHKISNGGRLLLCKIS